MILISPVFAVATKACSSAISGSGTFFGFPHWWQYMQCVPDGSGTGSYTPYFGGPSDMFGLALAIINMLLYAAGFVAVIAIIVAGVNYITAIGNPEKITSSRKSIQNALIGLAICLIAAQVVAFIGTRLGP